MTAKISVTLCGLLWKHIIDWMFILPFEYKTPPQSITQSQWGQSVDSLPCQQEEISVKCSPLCFGPPKQECGTAIEEKPVIP